jgi:flagellar biosynthesis/type III secretory pathway protein FliH
MSWQQDDVDQEELYDDEPEDDAEEEAPEPELPPETQALIDAARQKAVAEAEKQFRAAAQKRGLAFTGDDLAVADYAQFATGFGFAAGQQEGRAEPPPPPAPPPPDDPMPDPNFDGVEALRAWQVRERQRIVKETVEATVAQFKPELERLQGSLAARDQVGAAVERAREVLPEYGFGHVADDPDFDRLYRETLLAELQPSQWSDEAAILAVSGVVAKRMRDRGNFQTQRPPARSRDESGRFEREGQQRMLAQFGPSRPTSRSPRAPELTREDRQDLAFLGRVFPEMGGDLDTVLAAESSERLTQHLRAKKAKG